MISYDKQKRLFTLINVIFIVQRQIFVKIFILQLKASMSTFIHMYIQKITNDIYDKK